ncbi:MAG: rhomboid family intramembrane serine protease [Balneolales bacterium]
MAAYGDSFGTALKWGYLGMPRAIRTILAVNVGIYFLQTLITVFGGERIVVAAINTFGFIPDWSIVLIQPWRLMTYMFLHGSVLHVAFNMLWLWWMGRPVEEQLGSRNFLVIYLGSGIGGALINLVLSPLFNVAVTIGASGAVFGMMVAFAMLFPTVPIMLLFFPPIEARFLVAGLIAIDLLFISSADNVARIVHLGGAFWGYILLKLYFRGYHYDLWFEMIKQKFKTKRAPRTKSAGKSRMEKITEAEIVEEYDRDEMDRILDKISKSGYDGLTTEEKRLLFELSRKN